MALNGVTKVPETGGGGGVTAEDSGGPVVEGASALSFPWGVTDDGDGTATIPEPGGSGGPSDERGRQNQAWFYGAPSGTFDWTGAATNVKALSFNGDASKMYLLSPFDVAIYEFVLSTPAEVSTASLNQTVDLSGTAAAPNGMAWKPDGTELYVSDGDNAEVYQFSLGTAYDPSTASLSYTKDVSGAAAIPKSVSVGDGGLRLWVPDNSGSVHEYMMDPNYDLSISWLNRTASSGVSDCESFRFEQNGAVAFLVDDGGNTIRRHAAGASYDISTLELGDSIDVESIGNAPTTFRLSPDGSRWYLTDGGTGRIHEFTA